MELKSTQKQAIAAKQNVHSLTINRADLTDAGMKISSLYSNIRSPFEQVFTKQSLIMVPANLLKQLAQLQLAVRIVSS